MFFHADLEAFLLMMKFVDGLTHEEPLNSIVAHGPPRTDEELIQYVSSIFYDAYIPNGFDRQVKAESRVMFHPIGTVPMCSKELGGVVDPELRVYGTKNLRVGESDMPFLCMPQLQTAYAVCSQSMPVSSRCRSVPCRKRVSMR